MADLSFYSDRELFLLISRENELAFAELFRRYDKRIYPFVLKMIRSEVLAEEITQEIFIKLWVNRHKLPEIDRPDAYILTIASNHTLDQIRKQLNQAKMLRIVSGRLTDSFSNITEDTLQLRASKELIDQAVELLPPQQKKVYNLSRKEGFSNEEIAEQLNLSFNTVRRHLTEALHSIRNYLKEKGQLALISSIPFLMYARLYFF